MEYKKIFVDSSVLVAYYNPNDSQYEKALSAFTKLQNKVQFFIHNLVLIETLTVLKKELNHRELLLTEDHLLNSNSFHLSENGMHIQDNSSIFGIFNHKNDLSMIDCFLIVYCLRNNFRLLTFDKAMEKIYHKFLP